MVCTEQSEVNLNNGYVARSRNLDIEIAYSHMKYISTYLIINVYVYLHLFLSLCLIRADSTGPLKN